MRKTNWKLCAILILAGVIIVFWIRFDFRRFTDPISFRQDQAIALGHADWGHWGTDPQKYSGWTSHSNRLIPIYTFGITLDEFTGENSIYRDATRLERLYGRMPEMTANPYAEYMDQTDVYHLQKQAIAQGKKYVFLIVFDGTDWQTTQAAAIYRNRAVTYDKGRGNGLAFQDYDKTITDFGFFVCSPYNDSTTVDVNAQIVKDRNQRFFGGYNAFVGGFHPWDIPKSYPYLIREDLANPHAFADSAATATAMTCGIKTFNGAINVDPDGKHVIPIARQLQDQGFSVGAVTSVPFSHATPACTYANNVSRDDYQDISRDMLGLSSMGNRRPLPGMDVVIGCGWGYQPKTKAELKTELKEQGINYVVGNQILAFDDLAKIDIEKGGDYRIAIRQAQKSGSDVLKQATEQAVKQGDRLFGLFGTVEGHLPYATADGDFKPARGTTKQEQYSSDDLSENPTLQEMTESALAVLEQNETGFWLLVESGDVDWANHENNIDDAIGAVFSGEAAFEAVVKWIERNDCWDEAAVIVTADHGHLFVLEDPSCLIPN